MGHLGQINSGPLTGPLHHLKDLKGSPAHSQYQPDSFGFQARNSLLPSFLQLFVARTSRLQQKRCSHQLQAKSLQHKSAAPAGRPSEWTSCSPFLPVASELVMSVPWNRPQLDHIGPRRPFPGWFCPCSKKNINYIDRCLALSSWWERKNTENPKVPLFLLMIARFSSQCSPST